MDAQRYGLDEKQAWRLLGRLVDGQHLLHIVHRLFNVEWLASVPQTWCHRVPSRWLRLVMEQVLPPAKPDGLSDSTSED